MPADFLANDFAAIARAMRRETAPAPKMVLHFWFRTPHASGVIGPVAAVLLLLSMPIVAGALRALDVNSPRRVQKPSFCCSR